MIVLSVDRIRTQLQRSAVPVASPDNWTSLRKAAVLVPIFRDRDEWHILFIRRSQSVQDHKGQVAFPGGTVESKDKSLEMTALREAKEEIGLIPSDVEVLGFLRDFPTITNYLITPVVGYISWPVTLSLHHAEVEKVFSIPISWLADPSHWEERPRKFPGGQMETVIYFQLYEGEQLWGATARMTLNLLRTLEIV